jgi:hypothetical protein
MTKSKLTSLSCSLHSTTEVRERHSGARWRSRSRDRMGRARFASESVRSMAYLCLFRARNCPFPTGPVRRRGGGCAQVSPIKSGLHNVPPGIGSTARKARTDRSSQSCCVASFGIATGIPLQPVVCRREFHADTSRLSGRGASRSGPPRISSKLLLS